MRNRDIIWLIVAVIVGVFAICFAIADLNSYNAAHPAPPPEPVTKYEVLQLNINKEQSASGTMVGTGIFYLGSFRQGEDIYFYAYVKKPNGAIKLIRFSNEAIEIFEDSNRPWAKPGIDDSAYNDSVWDNPTCYHWEFHIPPNSIYRNIDPNMKM